jgi:hypothetical protein
MNTRSCRFIYVHENNTVFSVPIFKKLYYFRISYIEFQLTRIVNMDIAARKSLPPPPQGKYGFYYVNFHETLIIIIKFLCGYPNLNCIRIGHKCRIFGQKLIYTLNKA